MNAPRILLAAAALALLACHSEAPVKEISIAELARLQREGAIRIFDVNTDEFREKNGMVPGATPLPSSADYPLSLLPADKGEKLAFYCANRH